MGRRELPLALLLLQLAGCPGQLGPRDAGAELGQVDLAQDLAAERCGLQGYCPGAGRCCAGGYCVDCAAGPLDRCSASR